MSSSGEKGIFKNKELERVIEKGEKRKNKLSKYEIALSKWKGEIDAFDEINIDLNLNPEVYLAIKEL